MKEKLRNCFLLAAMILMVGFISGVTANAAETYRDAATNEYSYQILQDGTASITAYLGNSTNITIPSFVTDEGGKTYRVPRIEGSSSSYYSTFRTCVSITIPDSVVSIGDNAFYYCTRLTSVSLKNGLQSIGEWAFYGCDSLKSIAIPKSVTSIGTEALGYIIYEDEDGKGPAQMNGFMIYGYSNSAAWTYANKNDISFTSLDGGQNFEGNYGVRDENTYTGDVRVTAGSGASRATYTTTGPDTAEYSFPAVASGVTEIVIPDTVTINGRSYKVTYIGSSAFAGNTTITKVSIGNNVQTIRSSAFAGCTNLKKVTGGKNLTYIYDRAFENCTKLKKVNLTSKSLIYIRNYAFRKCTSLKSFTSKSKKLTSIGEQAFAGDKKLKKITLSTKKLKKANVGKKAFKGIAKKCVFKVPAKKAGAYKKIFKARGAKKAIVK